MNNNEQSESRAVESTEQQMNEAVAEFLKKVITGKVVFQDESKSPKEQAELISLVIGKLAGSLSSLVEQIQEKEVK